MMKNRKMIAGLLAMAVTLSGITCYAGPAQNSSILQASASINDKSGEVIDGISYRRSGTYSLLGYLPEDYDKEYITVHSCADKTLKEVTLPAALEATNGGGTRMMVLGEIYEYAFSECNTLEKITIPDTVTSIDKAAFNLCSSLTDVQLPASLTFLGEGAFNECTALKQVTLPDGLKTIERLAFYKDTELAEVNLPDSVESIAEYAFGLCNLSGEIHLPASLQTLETYAFGGNYGITAYTISEENEKFYTEDGVLYEQDMYSDNQTNKLLLYPTAAEQAEWTVPDTVTSIASGAFLFAQNLETITLGESVKNIEQAAFQNASVKDIYILNKDCVVNTNSSNTIPSAITIHAPEDSYAQQYAENNGNPFVALAESTEPETTTTPETTTPETTTTETTTIEATSATETTESTTTETTTTEATTEATTTEAATTETTTTEVTTTQKPYASNETFCTWAINDYRSKTGIKAANYEYTENTDGTVTIILYGENGEVLDTYTINTVTGEGTASDGSAVNLPQTGITSPLTAAMGFGAAFLTTAGIALITVSKKRRED